jgi:hypothetical protein
MTVKSVMRVYDNKPFMVPITKELITLGHLANKNYKAYLDDKKKKEEESRKVGEREDESGRRSQEKNGTEKKGNRRC